MGGKLTAGLLFERLALGSNLIAEVTFDIEAALFGRAARAIRPEAPVFVVGLARAGTTALLRALFAQKRFATLTFRDLPFPLAPNSWARFGRGRHTSLDERGQEDGILQDLDSPEALEEVFWRVFDHQRYITPDRLIPYAVPPTTLEAYQRYVRLILLRYGKSRYLAKNNNNVLRLDSLVKAWPEALFLHPFRDPVQHAASLHYNHLQAMEHHRHNPARLAYMNRLVHHEFGPGHRPFVFTKSIASDTPEDPNHWLRQWIVTYRFLLERTMPLHGRQSFVNVDQLADNAGATDALIEAVTGAPPQPYPPFRTAKARDLPAMDSALLAEAWEVHGMLRARTLAPPPAVTPGSMPRSSRTNTLRPDPSPGTRPE